MANVETIAPNELSQAIKSGKPVVIVDVRTPAEFESEHILGAINIPLTELPAQLPETKANQELVLACRTDRRATTAAELLAAQGLASKVLAGGVTAWRNQGLALIEGRKSVPLDRQVQMIAGSLILSGTLLGVFVNKTWFVVPGFVGAGLTYAGLSGNCGLAVILSRAPWNRRPEPATTCSSSRS